MLLVETDWKQTARKDSDGLRLDFFRLEKELNETSTRARAREATESYRQIAARGQKVMARISCRTYGPKREAPPATHIREVVRARGAEFYTP